MQGPKLDSGYQNKRLIFRVVNTQEIVDYYLVKEHMYVESLNVYQYLAKKLKISSDHLFKNNTFEMIYSL